jgi:hypothetical protein
MDPFFPKVKISPLSAIFRHFNGHYDFLERAMIFLRVLTPAPDAQL